MFLYNVPYSVNSPNLDIQPIYPIVRLGGIFPSNSTRLSDLYNCYFSTNEIVRLRTSNAIKRISLENPEWLIPYIDKFISEISNTALFISMKDTSIFGMLARYSPFLIGRGQKSAISPPPAGKSLSSMHLKGAVMVFDGAAVAAPSKSAVLISPQRSGL